MHSAKKKRRRDGPGMQIRREKKIGTGGGKGELLLLGLWDRAADKKARNST